MHVNYQHVLRLMIMQCGHLDQPSVTCCTHVKDLTLESPATSMSIAKSVLDDAEADRSNVPE